ncbi:anti-sigma factor [Stieleria varia]|nr:hypothetical protein [Stieleria varia]
MSVPREMIDELLSGYLDDSLSGDERKRVEQLLGEQPELAAELTQLRELSQSIKQLAAVSTPGLKPGFADRVVRSAIEQAKIDGLPESHPLIRADQDVTVTPNLTPATVESKRSYWRVALGGTVAVAASIGFAIVMLRPPTTPDQQGRMDPRLAANVDDSATMNADSFVPPPIVPGTVDVGSNEPSLIAATTGDDSSDNASDGASAKPEMPVPDQVTDPPMIASNDTGRDGAQRNDTASDTSPITVPPAVEKVEPKAPGANITLAFVPVFEIQQTRVGREAGAFEQALAKASIPMGGGRKLTADLVAFVNKNLNAESDAADHPQILLLEGSAKKMDVLFNRLISDRENVEYVRFGLVTDAPILKMVNSIRQSDPTVVRHDAMGWPLQLPSNALTGALGERLSKQAIAPFAAGGLQMMAPAKVDGQDVKSQLLILLR